ncbi:MAG: glycosyltransferase [Thermoanaerobaculia bacterium]
MRIVVFGLTVSSSWGNGHATIWRGLLRALADLGCDCTFFERDVPYYADARDLHRGDGWELVLYDDWERIAPAAKRALANADAAIVTSYCPDAIAASALVLEQPRLLRVFYDLDTPVTLGRLARGESVDYIPADGLSGFDLVLSFTGGRALDELQSRLGARRTVPLFGSVDLDCHRRVPPVQHYASDLSYLGTYASDRQQAVEQLFVGAANALPDRRFLIGGSMYPPEFPWSGNIHFIHHVPPPEHPSFYCSSKITLNVTRASMAAYGYCPSGRLFEAAACGTPILSDAWEGLETFFEPGKEILVAKTTEDAIAAMEMPSDELATMAAAAYERVRGEHTARRRAEEMLRAFA